MMPPITSRLFCAACQCIVLGGFARSAGAQDTIKLLPTSLAGGSSMPQAQAQDQPYTVRWGDLRLLATGSFEAEWNDNIALTDSQREQDFILRPKVNLQGVLPLTDVNSFNLTLGIGYEFYTEHPADSRFLVTPGS